MPEIDKAFIIGGWSESVKSLEPLAESLGAQGLFREVDIFTLGKALEDKKINAAARNRSVVTHSAGAFAIHQAGLIVVLNGVEPTPLHRLTLGAFGVAFNRQIGHEEGVRVMGLADAAIELARSPYTLGLPYRLSHFSSLKRLIDYAEMFPEGRAYLPTDKDEFGFGGHGEVDKAREYGIYAEALPGAHSQPLLHPNAAAQAISRALESLGSLSDSQAAFV